MKRFFWLLCLGMVAAVAPAQDLKPEKEKAPMTDTTNLKAGVYARFTTSLGNFTAQLFTEKAPQTTDNFIALTEGQKEFKDPETGNMIKGRFYDNRKIFRVIDGFMFQTGAASDSNTYQSGFTIPDEIVPELKFDKAGILAMANTGRPNSGSCQFFVTLGATPHLTGGYTIFGEVVEGMDTVEKIGKVPVKRNPMGGEPSLPEDMPVIEKVEILRVEKE